LTARTRAKRVLLIGGVFVVFGAGLAYAAIPGADGTINGCYEKRTGLLRVIDAEAGKKCLSIETPISWNQKGLKGDQGSQGLQGQRGLQGEQGVPGAEGERGPQGEPGVDGERGPQGERGLQGVQGERGPQGAQGPPGAGGLSEGIFATKGGFFPVGSGVEVDFDVPAGTYLVTATGEVHNAADALFADNTRLVFCNLRSSAGNGTSTGLDSRESESLTWVGAVTVLEGGSIGVNCNTLGNEPDVSLREFDLVAIRVEHVTTTTG
jgi:Collagen triple helix repeat (20 copies)